MIEPAPAEQVSPFLSTVMLGTAPCRTQHLWTLSSGLPQLEAFPSTIHSPPGVLTTRHRLSGPRYRRLVGSFTSRSCTNQSAYHMAPAGASRRVINSPVSVRR